MYRNVQITAFTHQGNVRQNNEDTIVIRKWVRNAPMSVPRQWRFVLDTPVLCAVADGIGGQAAGEIASQYVAKQISKSAQEIVDAESLGKLLCRTNEKLYDLMATDRSLTSMGTTVVGLLLNQEFLLWFNVGDSRLYRDQNGNLIQISVDDVPESMDIQIADHRRQSHAITQSLGGTKKIQKLVPHTGIDQLTIPSRWLLCSDGLTDMVGVVAIEACMRASDIDAISKLMEAAVNAGGKDNISIIIVSAFSENSSA